MSNGKEISYEIPDHIYPEVVVRENALVILNDAAADVIIETSRFFIRIGGERNETVSTRCDKVHTWTVSGKHSTGTDGIAKINLNKFLECIPATIESKHYSKYIGSRPNFTATPETEDPAFLTFTIDDRPIDAHPTEAFLPAALEIEITVRSWNHGGNPAANIPFNWIAIARTAISSNL